MTSPGTAHPPTEAERRREQVLAALVESGEGGCSGAALATRLSCSRASVHRHVEALRREGLDVVSGPLGYRLAPGQDPVVPLLVAPRMAPPLAGPLTWLRETTSTNDDVAALARAGAPEGLVVGADHQTAGRGRRGRAWVGRPGDALLFSVLLRPPLGPLEVGLLPIVVAVAVAEAVESLGVDEVAITWPNDVLVGGRKLAGVLCELSADQERVAWAVAGIGLNVRPVPDADGMRWPPASLEGAGRPVRRADALAAVLAALARRYATWLQAGAADVLGAFARRDHLVGRHVRLMLGSREVAGEALGLDDLGRLRVRTPEGERALASGEVTKVGGPGA